MYFYPGDKNATQHYQDNCRLWQVSERVVQYDCDIFKGQRGSALIRYSEEFKLYYILGVITSEHIYKNLGSRLTPEGQKIIRAISDETYNASNFNEQFVTLDHSLSKEINIIVKNDCSKPLLLATYYKNLDQGWLIDGFYTLEGGETKVFHKTENGIFYFAGTYNRGQTYANRYDLTRNLDNGNGKTLNLKRVIQKFGVIISKLLNVTRRGSSSYFLNTLLLQIF
ncbi:serine protease [Bacteriovorax sp. Seq25_V]|uniref:trypsin-like serine peptidase n=1 Tax=Bacteriovorax sp. Seq25_V TaxID=1201288 RepID=UPI000389EACA|nr:hypothetical protein [Bacteriovorax sp. Seq25_V]EQC47120.1 hypothetical protein M900_0931 [Bacteriovorax sp. Seq25_V]